MTNGHNSSAPPATLHYAAGKELLKATGVTGSLKRSEVFPLYRFPPSLFSYFICQEGRWIDDVSRACSSVKPRRSKVVFKTSWFNTVPERPIKCQATANSC